MILLLYYIYKLKESTRNYIDWYKAHTSVLKSKYYATSMWFWIIISPNAITRKADKLY